MPGRIGYKRFAMSYLKPVKNVLETIGNTPIVKLNRIGADLPCEIYVKLEMFNPGGSIKDRLGYYLIEDAEKRGTLKPGGTVIEGTSGNTGFGLAITAAIKGYKCIFILPDKMSEEKISSLRSFGAKVIVTPTAVEPDDPRSYYSVSRQLAKDTPNSVYLDQYNNLANREMHAKWTGPEILEQMPDLDVFIAGIGTGGTVCGCGQYFKKVRPELQVVAVDPVGSIVYDKFKHNKDVPAHTYKIEGIGEDFLPANYDFSVIDDMSQVEDKESFVMTRELLLKEGIYAGVSCGAAVVGGLKWLKAQGDKMKGKKVLIVLPDGGAKYLSKVYNDAWMREAGFLDEDSSGTVDDVLHHLHIKDDAIVMAQQNDKISSVIEQMKEKGFSQLPVCDDSGWIKGVITEGRVLAALYEGKARPTDPAASLTDTSVEFVKKTDPVEKVSQLVTSGKTPLVTDANNKVVAILAKIDLLSFLSSR